VAAAPAPEASTSALAPVAPPLPDAAGRSRLGLVVACVVTVIVVAGGVVLATGGDDEGTAAPAAEQSPADDAADAADGTDDELGPTGESPVDVAEEFFDAVAEHDCAGVVARMTPESYGTGGQTAEQAVIECENDATGTAAAAAAEYDDVELVSEAGDEATVTVTITAGRRETQRELPLRRVDGEWLMHLDTSLAIPVG
jgi:hypothetical protein